MNTLMAKPATHHEECVSCHQLTGHAGIGDGSLYSEDGDRGPFCDDCGHYDDKVVQPELDRLRAEVRHMRAAVLNLATAIPMYVTAILEPESMRAVNPAPRNPTGDTYDSYHALGEKPQPPCTTGQIGG